MGVFVWDATLSLVGGAVKTGAGGNGGTGGLGGVGGTAGTGKNGADGPSCAVSCQPGGNKTCNPVAGFGAGGLPGGIGGKGGNGGNGGGGPGGNSFCIVRGGAAVVGVSGSPSLLFGVAGKGAGGAANGSSGATYP